VSSGCRSLLSQYVRFSRRGPSSPRFVRYRLCVRRCACLRLRIRQLRLVGRYNTTTSTIRRAAPCGVCVGYARRFSCCSCLHDRRLSTATDLLIAFKSLLHDGGVIHVAHDLATRPPESTRPASVPVVSLDAHTFWLIPMCKDAHYIRAEIFWYGSWWLDLCRLPWNPSLQIGYNLWTDMSTVCLLAPDTIEQENEVKIVWDTWWGLYW